MGRSGLPPSEGHRVEIADLDRRDVAGVRARSTCVLIPSLRAISRRNRELGAVGDAL